MSILTLIEAHRAALLADEASFTEDCEPIDKALADATGEAENTAFEELVRARCLTADDVAAKVSYFLEPPVDFRCSNAGALVGGDGCCWSERTGPELLVAFLRSLVLTDAGAPPPS